MDSKKAENTFSILSWILSSPVFTRRYNPKTRIRIRAIRPPIEYNQIKVAWFNSNIAHTLPNVLSYRLPQNVTHFKRKGVVYGN
jgi:hypothetical protein